MPSLKPNRLRGVAWLVDVDDVRPNPSCDHRTAVDAEPHPHQVAHGVHGDLRVVRARLDAQVAAGTGRVELVAGEPGQVDQRGRPLPGEARASSSSDAPTPNVRVSDAAGSPSASPVSVGGAFGVQVDRAVRR